MAQCVANVTLLDVNFILIRLEYLSGHAKAPMFIIHSPF